MLAMAVMCTSFGGDTTNIQTLAMGGYETSRFAENTILAMQDGLGTSGQTDGIQGTTTQGLSEPTQQFPTVTELTTESVTTQQITTQTTTTQVTTAQVTTTQATTKAPVATTQELKKDEILYLYIGACKPNSLTLKWTARRDNASMYSIYRRCKYDSDYVKLGDVSNRESAVWQFTDNTFLYGISYEYKVVPYHVLTDGQVVSGTESSVLTVKKKLEQPAITKAVRSGKKVTLKWKKLEGVKGYEIYRSTKKGYKLAKRIKTNKNSCVLKNISTSSEVTFKIRAFVTYNGNRITGGVGTTKTIFSTYNQKIADKFKKLQKQYPSYAYWNHMGKTSFSSTTITNTPCNHNLYGMRYCNYYHCPNRILGLQCYGFAWKMSDLIYGKNAKITKHKSFAKAQMGDVIRYQGHSVIIVEKHKNYIIAGECNIGDTCMILWGRKIKKSELKGASYSHRNLSSK